MRLALALLFVAAFSGFCQSQDVKVREESIRLMERAHAVSSSPALPNLERIDTFRAFAEDSPAQEGSFTRVMIQGTGRRDEYNFGSFHLLNVWTEKQVAVAGKAAIVPPELVTLSRITPILLVRFDGEDVIHSITSREVNGVAARCMDFDTIRGQKVDNNQLCVDVVRGTLLQEKLGPELIEYSEFFPFAGALMPGKIRYSFGGVEKLEITQTMAPLNEITANVLAAPPDATMHRICTTFRRPFGVSMPQPKSGNGGSDTEIIVRGMVGVNGKVYEPVVQSSERPDLNAEALTQVQQWTFTPAMCDGQPDAHEVAVTLHFQGR